MRKQSSCATPHRGVVPMSTREACGALARGEESAFNTQTHAAGSKGSASPHWPTGPRQMQQHAFTSQKCSLIWQNSQTGLRKTHIRLWSMTAPGHDQNEAQHQLAMLLPPGTHISCKGGHPTCTVNKPLSSTLTKGHHADSKNTGESVVHTLSLIKTKHFVQLLWKSVLLIHRPA